MSALATADDVAVSLMRDLTAPEQRVVDQLLARAERKLLARIPALLSDTVDEGRRLDITAVEADMVARVFRNPEGMSSESDGTYNYSRNLAVASGLLDVLDGEWELLGCGPDALGSVAPALDGYARARHPLDFQTRPDLALQYQSPYPGGIA